MRVSFLLAWSLLIVSCTTHTPDSAGNYNLAKQPDPVLLVFKPGMDTPDPPGAVEIAQFGRHLPAWVQPVLLTSDPHVGARALAVRRLLGRRLVVQPVGPDVAATGVRDIAVLTAPSFTGTIPDACLGNGQLVPGDSWPGNDADRSSLLPGGCAAAWGIEVQVQAADAGNDLLQGQPLPPGAATPFADAIERYYRRNTADRSRGPGENRPSDLRGNANTPLEPGGELRRPAEQTGTTNPLFGPLTP